MELHKRVRYFLNTKFCLLFTCGLKCDIILLKTENEREIIENYFHAGYKYDLIVCLLMKKHGIEMTVRTLKRRLKSYHLSRRNENISEDNVRTLLRQEM